MTKQQYRIVSTKETDEGTGQPLYWQHDFGWSDRDQATCYRADEIGRYLPLNSTLEPIDLTPITTED